jgi:uncharacterized membrane protein YgaE (UPF0421/DUF939 family)
MKVIYDSALRNALVNEKDKVIKTVLPNLTAFYSILNIRDIIEKKATEKRKELEKAEREGKKVTFEEETEENKANPTTEEVIMRKRLEDKLVASNMSHFSE